MNVTTLDYILQTMNENENMGPDGTKDIDIIKQRGWKYCLVVSVPDTPSVDQFWDNIHKFCTDQCDWIHNKDYYYYGNWILFGDKSNAAALKIEAADTGTQYFELW